MDEIISAHEAEYGVKPECIASAPGRFHLVGEHTWFFKDKTLSMAVNIPVYVAVSQEAIPTFGLNLHNSRNANVLQYLHLSLRKKTNGQMR